ncbi:MAG: hypothetical protein HYW50_03140 [Candidatus Diapherotrites archaeon]|nr:hypothetical protein [Candidatus Diapherotrites archaeon]
MEKKPVYRILFGKIGKMKKVLSQVEIADFGKKFDRFVDDPDNWNGDLFVLLMNGKQVQGCINYCLDKAFGPRGVTIENMLSKNRKTSSHFRESHQNWSIARELIAQIVRFHKANVVVFGHPISLSGSTLIKEMVDEGLLEGTQPVLVPTKKLKPRLHVQSTQN